MKTLEITTAGYIVLVQMHHVDFIHPLKSSESMLVFS